MHIKNLVLIIIILFLLIGAHKATIYKDNMAIADAKEINILTPNTTEIAKPIPTTTQQKDTNVAEEEIKVTYVTNMDDAIKKSKELNKNILIFFHAKWCNNCEYMIKYFGEKDVKTALSNYVVYICNVEVDRKTASKYNVHLIPLYVIVDNTQQILKQGKGQLSAKDFINWLNKK